jgi:hypothetical protein
MGEEKVERRRVLVLLFDDDQPHLPISAKLAGFCP